VVNNTASNDYDNLSSYPPENHHSSDDVYCKVLTASRDATIDNVYHKTISQVFKYYLLCKAIPQRTAALACYTSDIQPS